MDKKHKKGSIMLNYIEHLFILVFAVTGCIFISAFASLLGIPIGVFISAFASLLGIPIGIESSAIGLETCAITAVIKKYKSIIEKTKKKYDKMVLFAKANNIKVLISKFLIDLYVSHNEFVLVNNAIKGYDNIKEEINNLKTSWVSKNF